MSVLSEFAAAFPSNGQPANVQEHRGQWFDRATVTFFNRPPYLSDIDVPLAKVLLNSTLVPVRVATAMYGERIVVTEVEFLGHLGVES